MKGVRVGSSKGVRRAMMKILGIGSSKYLVWGQVKYLV